jgi:hypothetical protein
MNFTLYLLAIVTVGHGYDGVPYITAIYPRADSAVVPLRLPSGHCMESQL